uniref:Ig-like domain-containing protein n=1 Tax=Mastacembelus armatus TaxID=205130 RepID=A0A3Q3MG35_9TELE
MPGLGHFLLSVCILGCILGSSGAWHVTMPSNIKGLKGSCLVIPCTFDYNQYPPVRPDRVVWYQHVSRGYPLVYDSWYPKNVIDIFRGRTRKADSTKGKSCSLRIYPVNWPHHRQKIYPWVDPENVGYSTYRFYDTTVTIDVTDRAEKPSIRIFGELKVGQSVQVECTVYHTCSTDPPTLSLNIRLRSPSTTQSSMSDGTSKTSMIGTLFITRERQTVECSARHYEGPTTSASITLNAQCSFAPLTIKPTSDEFLEGEVGKVTCIAKYTCSQHVPTFTWSDKNIPVSSEPKVSNAEWMTVSTLTFTVSASDHDRLLTCKVFFSQGKKLEVSVTLRVKRNVHFRDWSFTTPSTITGMRGSCIIIPCRFTYRNSQPADLRVMWYLYQGSSYSLVYGQSQTVDIKYTGLTSFIGSVPEGNCTLKVERLDITHNKDRFFPWLDKAPITSYHNPSQTFYDKNTQLIVSDRAEEPQLSVNGDPRVGEESKVSCTVHHTCPSAPPTLTMNGIQGADVTRGSMLSDGVWERTVERTWIVKEEDQSVKCTVSYQGGQKATSELRLNVECPYDRITMVEPPGETIEGVAKSVICSVTYKCKKNAPTIVWNYKDVQSSLQTKKLPRDTFEATSNLTFIGSLSDNGKTLTCTAQFSHGETSDSAILRIKRNVHFRDWSFTTPSTITGMRGSCIIIPCRFTYRNSQPADLRVMWYLYQGSSYSLVYGQSQTVDIKYTGLTSFIGSVPEGNCTLKVERLDITHNKDRFFPWLDKAPITSYHNPSQTFYDKNTQLIVSGKYVNRQNHHF